ncbi:MAG: hypothetical protein M0T80_12265 [Actinomycetota bacterium]|nr:hypothetical protein [Actinomycetota bacterium]
MAAFSDAEVLGWLEAANELAAAAAETVRLDSPRLRRPGQHPLDPRRLAGQVAVEARNKHHDPTDWVTGTDERIEARIAAELHARFPDHGFEGEEGEGRRQAVGGSPRWLVDPLDGTTNFVAGLGNVGVSLAAASEDRLHLGVVADVWRGSLLAARDGAAPTLDGLPVGASTAQGLAGGIVMTELVGATSWAGLGRFAESVSGEGGCLRVIGSTALSLAAVATGVARAAVLAGYHHLDTAAACLAARQGGARLYGPPEERLLPSTAVPGLNGLVVAAPGVAEDVLEMFLEARRGAR